MKKPYLSIVNHYENCFNKYGDSFLGVDWQNQKDAEKRYQVMLDIIQRTNGEIISLLDFGCGTAALCDYINMNNLSYIEYSGLDISSAFIKVSQSKYPDVNFYNIDILDSEVILPKFDYIIMNGVFTEKMDLTFEQMFKYFCAMLEKIFPYCQRAIAFNIRSYHVVNKYDDLFHLPFDILLNFLTTELSDKYIIRNDYELDEYTVYLYKKTG